MNNDLRDLRAKTAAFIFEVETFFHMRPNSDLIAAWDNGLCVGIDPKDHKTPYATNAMKAASAGRYQGLTGVVNGKGESPKLIRRKTALMRLIAEQEALLKQFDDMLAVEQHRPAVNTPYQLGDRVMVCADFGSQPPIEVTITGIDEKNGRPLITYRDGEGHTRWAYTMHISRPAH